MLQLLACSRFSGTETNSLPLKNVLTVYWINFRRIYSIMQLSILMSSPQYTLKLVWYAENRARIMPTLLIHPP